MSDEDAFLAAIRADPADDMARLAFADWLDEHDQPDRADFIRVQCEIARLCDSQRAGTATLADCERQLEVFQREGRLATVVYPAVVWPIQSWLRSLGIDPYGCVYNRGGWLASVTCMAAVWVAHGDAILRQQPVQFAVLTTAPLLTGDDDGVELANDPERMRFAWVAVREAWREGDPERESAAGVIVPLMRLRWPDVEFCWTEVFR